MKLAVPDLISPSYFPAIAAIELGLARDEGLDVELELRFPVTDAAAALRDGYIDFLAGSAHAALGAFPGWRGLCLPAALSRNMYWFLVVRPDLCPRRGDLSALCDVTIGAAPGPVDGLRVMLDDLGLDVEAMGIEIRPVEGVEGNVSFGVTAAAALEAGVVDGFWANGMGAEVAVRQGVGEILVDARRGDGPPGSTGYTFASLMARKESLGKEPQRVRGMAKAVVRAQEALREDPGLATRIGERLFPPLEASLIAELVSRDAPFYQHEITRETIASVESFAGRIGLPVRDEEGERHDPLTRLLTEGG